MEPPSFELLDREREALRLLADGSTPTEAATALMISPRTLRNHVRNVSEKIDRALQLEGDD